MADRGLFTPALEWLLGLENIRLGQDAPLVLTWARPLPAWVLFCLAASVVTVVALVYRRERALQSAATEIAGGRRAAAVRVVLPAAVRCATVAIVVAILCRPSLVLQRNRVERSYVALAVDTSMSMATRDQYGLPQAGPQPAHAEPTEWNPPAPLRERPPDRSVTVAALTARIAHGAGISEIAELEQYSRLELIQRALVREDAAPLRELAARNDIRLYTFSDGVESAGSLTLPHGRGATPSGGGAHPTGRKVGPPYARESIELLADEISGVVADGTSTDLAGAIIGILERTQGRHLAAIVLASDGRATQSAGGSAIVDAIDLARGRQIPVYPIRFGSTERVMDVAVESVRAEGTAFANDLLALEVGLAASGLPGPTQVSVHLKDELTGATVASKDVAIPGGDGEVITVELLAKPTRRGVITYRVEVPPLPGERDNDNNADTVEVAIADEHLRVLFVDGYPRYEYRYLKNALLREETIELSVLLLEADPGFVQEGSVPIRRFPETPEELNRYDVVLFGDVDPRGGWLTSAQVNMLLDFVGNDGGGFGLIAGERAAPRNFLGTPLEKLIPVRVDRKIFGQNEQTVATGFNVRLTPEGRRSPLFRFGRAAQTNTGAPPSGDGLFDSLPELYWMARTLGPKPGAAVLAEHPTTHVPSATAADPVMMPIIVTGRYGAGRIFFQATDDTWRWRRYSGEWFHDTYWVRVARELMKPDRSGKQRRILLRTDRKTYPFGSPVRAQVEVLDMQLLSALGDEMELVLTETPDRPQTRRPGPAHDPTAQDDADNRELVARFPAFRLGEVSAEFEGAIIPPRAGNFVVSIGSLIPNPEDGNPSVRIKVKRPEVEARCTEADHEALERIAAGTSGRVVEMDELASALSAIRDRSVRIPDDLVEPLWDSKLTLVLFGLMISMEWILRKAGGLL